jgi:hypothetical protein
MAVTVSSRWSADSITQPLKKLIILDEVRTPSGATGYVIGFDGDGNGTDRVSARCDLGDNPGLVFITPCPPPPGTGEHFQPAGRHVRLKRMVKHRHKPIPSKEIVKLAYPKCREKVGTERRLLLTDTFLRTKFTGADVATS